MISLDPITPRNAMIFKEVRLRALQDAPSAFSSTYAKEAQLSDADWIERAVQWSEAQSVAYLALDKTIACGIAGAFIDQDDAARAHLISMWVAPPAPSAWYRRNTGQCDYRVGPYAARRQVAIAGHI